MQETARLKQQIKEFQFTLSQISHEIRNPVTLISSELQLMASRHPEIVSYENWDNILGNLEYLICLLNDLSDYNNSGRLSCTDTDPSSFLQKILTSIKPTYDYLGIKLEVTMETPLPVIQIDSIKMQQVLFNILRNARESISHSQGIIHISAVPYQKGICICIRDNGSGIPPEQRSTVFLPFVTCKPGGTGLGLAIAKHIVEAHNGRLELYHSSEKGTEFRIFLG